MDYEKKYNEALERAQKVKHDAETIGCSLSPDMLEVIFPELAESEDERIWQWLYDLVDNGDYLCERPFATESILAYLEKQKKESLRDFIDNFPYSAEQEKQKEQKPAENWKPSEEQMKALEDTLSDMPEHYKPKCTLETLLRDLKKL